MNLHGCRRIEYLAGVDKLAFKAEIPHGSGRREVTVTVDPETLQRLVQFLTRFPKDDWPHAFWHWEEDRPVPCSTCRTHRVEIPIDIPTQEAP